MSGVVSLAVFIGKVKHIADFAVFTDTVPGMYEHVNVEIDGAKQQCVVEDRRWEYKVLGGQVVSTSCQLYLQERK